MNLHEVLFGISISYIKQDDDIKLGYLNTVFALYKFKFYI